MTSDASQIPDIKAIIASILDELDQAPDRALGGPAAPAARDNARRVADYLLNLGDVPLPRHAGKPAPGKVAEALSTTKRFNRQNFQTNEWCSRLLNAYHEWEIGHGATKLDAAQAAADAKEPQNKRISILECELLMARAEIHQLRRELGLLREFVANTGRLP